MSELEKLCAKRSEMQSELDLLRPQQVKIHGVISRVLWLSTALCDCDKMIANARVNAVNKKEQVNETN